MTTNLKNKAYQIIKERIMSCDYKPNTFLNEADLIEEIDASRTPIREALNKLEQEGFVQIIPKKRGYGNRTYSGRDQPDL
ncbi:MAG: GntR family transcriptional regulator [Clostridium sp.]